ncbi:FAD:protein FMN transferase [Pseudoalteromonas tunicata]|uniref:FAD:protein FMN transferase n=1 Tax=Pseudoalteromonas tunicata TaxID=314281 RepID=UPI00273F5DA9|nr:FAD:protein FMN transferase [Pseudoalteromonas tunicata]MDP4984422.1 FAD:protein FMN transferase [Pseudoalteromonas tunicata]
MLQKRMRPLLGTFVEVAIVQGDLSQSHLNQAFSAAFSKIENIQTLMSFHQPDSALSVLNRHSGVWQPCDRDIYRVLRLAQVLYRSSSGLFNISCTKPLQTIGLLPQHFEDEIFSKRNTPPFLINNHRVKITQGHQLCVDGIAKGYAVDCAQAVLKSYGIKAGSINAGGDLSVFGELQIAVFQQNQHNERQYLGHIANAAVATSCGLATTSHPAAIVDPNGEIISAGCWSVLAKKAWRADALTKVVALQGEVVDLTPWGGLLLTPADGQS